MIDIMVDLETRGNEPGSVVAAIAAVAFERVSGHEKQVFYTEIDVASCVHAGLVEDPGTMAWWAKQSAEAQKCLIGVTPLTEALHALNQFYHFCEPEHVWAQGKDFEFGIMGAAYRAVGMAAPWRYYKGRDTRTAYDLYRLDARSVPRDGTYHHAVDDCRHQIKCLTIAMNGSHL